MHEVLFIENTGEPDGELVSIGPDGGVLKRRLLLPLTFNRKVFLGSRNLEMTIQCELFGERYEAKSVNVQAADGFVSTRDLTQLGIPRVIRSIASDLVPNFVVWTALGMRGSPLIEELRQDHIYLAQMYWLHNAVHGKPRIELAEALGISKSTSNVLLRRIEETIPLPRENSVKN
jgi:hypothetical protein